MNKLWKSVWIVTALSMPIAGHADWSFKGLGATVGIHSNATAINDSGQVAGWGSIAGNPETHAFITGPNGVGVTDLGTLGGSESFAYGINDSGQVVGYSFMDGTGEINHAFITGPNGVTMIDLGTFGGQSSFAHAINDSGQVVVVSNIPNDSTGRQDHAFITGPNGLGMTDLGLSGGGGVFWPGQFGINDSGQVVGSHFSQAFITGPDGLGVTDLGPFKGPPVPDQLSAMRSYATDLNDSGQVVGFAESVYYSNYHYGFITGPDGVGMTNLGVFFPNAVNNSGEAVSGNTLFSHGGMTDLNLLDVVISAGWSDLYVQDINNFGQMVGAGIDNHGNYQAFLLSYTPDTVFTPGPIIAPSIPEPETYAMLITGLGFIGFMVRRRKHI